MKITAYKCPDSGVIFEHVADYTDHRRRYCAEQAVQAARLARISGADAALAGLRATAASFEAVAEWIVQHQETLIDRCGTAGRRKRQLRRNQLPFRLLEVELDRMRSSGHISNSHSAPLGQSTNWQRAAPLPTGYPGYSGTIRFKTQGEYDGFFTDIFKQTGICTGGGGSFGGGHYQYEVILWAADWPGIHTWQRLSDG